MSGGFDNEDGDKMSRNMVEKRVWIFGASRKYEGKKTLVWSEKRERRHLREGLSVPNDPFGGTKRPDRRHLSMRKTGVKTAFSPS